MALPWNIILPAAIALFSSMGLFGGGDRSEEEAIGRSNWERMFRRMTPTQYIDPQMARTILQALMNQVGRSSGWGWPEGMGLDMSSLNIPGLMGGQGEQRRIRPS